MTKANSFNLTKIALAVSTALLLASCASAPPSKMTMTAPTPIPIQAMAGYFPVEIQNNIGTGSSAFPVTHAYLLFSAQESVAPNQQCLMSLSRNASIITYNAWVANCIPLTMQSQASQYAYSMDSLQVNAGPVVIYIPPVISGRAFVSLNYPLDVPMTRAADGSVSIQAPSLGNPTDGNYNLIYDKFEYTYTPSSTGQPTFWIDTTSVDDFSLPIALSYTDPQTQITQLNGYTNQDRDAIMGNIQSILGAGDASWQSLEVVDSVSNTGTIMRVDAPNTSPNFNANYLTPVDSSFNYRGALINYYAAGKTLSIDCAEVYPAGTPANEYTFTGTITNNQFVFQNSPNTGSPTVVTIDIANAPSDAFFGPGQAPLDTPNKTVRSVIVKNLTALFSVGLLPAPDGTALSPTYFKQQKAAGVYYQKNAILSHSPYTGYSHSHQGPWYDLYAQAIHQTAANPVYAFAFDDVLKQDGTLSIINANNNQSQPVIITLGSVDQLQVPLPGSNYTSTPSANDIAAVSDVKNPSFSCTSTSCTLQASWTLPPAQDPAVQYFVLPTPSPVETSTVLKHQALRPSFATGSTITFPAKLKPIPTSVNAVTVYACIPHPSDTKAIGYDCPSEANGYGLAPLVVGATSPSAIAPILGVQNITNSGFVCKAGSCTLTATYTIPKAQPSYAVYYIVPHKNNQASIVDIMKGQTLTTGTTQTLTLKESEVSTQSAPITVYTCGNTTTQFCPNSGNGYNQGQSPGVNAPAP
ncbi:MAG: beta-1,3-glucanase family protein [Gammaproteobacteria bacterium]|nr:beta-1,3-glucanase family protein [Gammaproteobacteria bacterium]